MRKGTIRISNKDYVFAEQNVDEMAVEAQNYLWSKVPIFCILPLTASSDNFGLKIKVREDILAEPHALEFLKSVQREPSYGCLKFIRGLAILRSVHQCTAQPQLVLLLAQLSTILFFTEWTLEHPQPIT